MNDNYRLNVVIGLTTADALQKMDESWKRHFHGMSFSYSAFIVRLYQHKTMPAPSKMEAYSLLGVDPNTGRRYLRRLHVQKWIHFVSDSIDGRRSRISPTTKLIKAFNEYGEDGKSILAEMSERFANIHDPPL